MKLNRKSVTWGLAGLALAGALVGGAGVAVAATGTTSVSPSTVSSADPPTVTWATWRGWSPRELADGRGGGHLSLSETDLLAQLQNGKSLVEVAAAQGTSVSGLEDAMVAAMTTSLDANTTVTPEEKAADLAPMKSHLDVMVSATHTPGVGSGPMDAGMGGMIGR